MATPAQAPATLESGEMLLPGIVVERHLHRSKDADVYEVSSSRHRTTCIAKVLRPDRIREGTLRRLRIEADALARLAHPNIVRSLGFDEAGPLLLLERLPGRPVRHELAAMGDAPWLLVADIGAQLASALHYLHGEGLVHADVKPANAITDGRRVTLIDFGLAREPGPVRTGLGTRQFVSPEQARGGEIDGATDVWGVGVIMYRAATGTLPWTGDEGYPQVDQPAPPVRERRNLPGRLAACIDDALAHDPARRPSAGELHDRIVQARTRLARKLARPLA